MPAASATDQSALAEEQAALRRVATLVARGVRPAEIFAAVSEEVGRLFGSEAAIARFEPDGSAMVVVGLTAGITVVSIGDCWELKDFLASTAVYRTGRPARYDHMNLEHASGPIADSLREMGIVSSVAAPIRVGGNLWGVITASDTHKALPQGAEERLESFTELVSTAIVNAESRTELAASEAHARKLAEEQAALRRVATLVARAPASETFFSAVAREVGSILNVPAVLVARFEADGTVDAVGAAYGSDLSHASTFLGVGTRMPPNPGSLAAQVFDTHRAARVDDYSTVGGAIGDAARAAGLGSGCACPIVVNGNLWGQLAVFSRTATVLPVGLENRLHDFVELVATAIANYEGRAELAASEARARELADEQAALRRVATLVAQGAGHDEVFLAVAREVAGVIKISNVGVNRFDPDGMTILAVVNDPRQWAGTTWPVVGVIERVLATGRPARQDDFRAIPGPLDDPVMEELRRSAEEPRGVVAVPIIVESSVWGFIAATAEPGESIPVGTEERLARFTQLVATAVSNATTRTELLTSRARLVVAADETRRRLERDLHDGIQQSLVTLMLEASKAAAATTSDPRSEFSRIADELVAVIDELRKISRGIHPAILTDAGLDAALKALARRSAVRVVLDVNFEGRYEPTLEATVYYVVAESITNAVKHANASVVTVRGGLRGEKIELEIEDDGVGGADPRRGSGIIGLTDRVDSLRGTILIASPAGAGTTIRVTLPIGPRDESERLLGLPADAASIAPTSG